MERTVSIAGMHCESCVRRLTESLSRVPGVRSARVTLSPPQAVLDIQDEVSTDALRAAIRSAGSYQLVESHQPPQAVELTPEPKKSLYPLVLIVGYITGVVLLIAMTSSDGIDWRRAMVHFMAGFFLVFSFFKLLDLRGFADAYQSYDILARRSRTWALVYPFIELVLGVAYLLHWQLQIANILTLILMLFGSIGVLRALLKKNAIRCACLGTALNLPMTTVTLVEDLGMALMAAMGLFWIH